jgi:hypothetical protein
VVLAGLCTAIAAVIACILLNVMPGLPNPLAASTATPEEIAEADTDTPQPSEEATEPAESPTPTVTNTATDVPPSATPDCTDNAVFVEDVTVPDNTIVTPQTTFSKTWRIKNTGTCTWNSVYSLDYAGGAQMSAAVSNFLSSEVPPEGTVDITVNFRAPKTQGTYTSEWVMRSPNIGVFGEVVDVQIRALNPTAVPTATLAPTKTPSITPTGPTPRPSSTPRPGPTATVVPGTGWKGEYYNNRNLSGSISLTRWDGNNLDFNWANGSPASSISSNLFSVRWTRTMNMPAGLYQFDMTADDGMRFFVDNAIMIDSWAEDPLRTRTFYIYLSGNHNFTAEYFEAYVDAQVKVTFKKVTTAGGGIPEWRGEYWNNKDFTGSPMLVRNDSFVDFNWSASAPASVLPADSFAARWTRSLSFPAGSYMFTLTMDDGARMSVDGTQIINDWSNGTLRSVTSSPVTLSAGAHNMLVEFFENTGTAQVKLVWELLSTVSGKLWQDVCPATNLPAAPAPPDITGCILNGSAVYQGNGALDAGEVGIGSIPVTISNTCGGTPVNTVMTDVNGNFSFPNLPAGTYCIEVDNSSLVPGFFTSPNANGEFTVTVANGATVTQNVGWDYQSMP